MVTGVGSYPLRQNTVLFLFPAMQRSQMGNLRQRPFREQSPENVLDEFGEFLEKEKVPSK